MNLKLDETETDTVTSPRPMYGGLTYRSLPYLVSWASASSGEEGEKHALSGIKSSL